ncbi:hypothetical protein [Sphingobium sp.]|uniref:hypothetical protein n=1 Tax=Sphingobium sp. TaxID=1912891 RepID=UPI002CBCB8FF|nr:hypothetical protein [Sphingobium sp.]HUD95633.1 hypothetical protein [Sphingobium sp.]
MTMLTSLKALLFTTPAQGAAKGNGVVAPTEGVMDFGQMLHVVKEGNSASSAAPIIAVQPAAPEPHKTEKRTIATPVSNVEQPARLSQPAVLAEAPAEWAELPAPATDVGVAPLASVADIELEAPVADVGPLLSVADADTVSIVLKPIAPEAFDAQPDMDAAAPSDAEMENVSARPVAIPVSPQVVRGDLIVEGPVPESDTDGLSIDSGDDRPVDTDDGTPAGVQPILTAVMPIVAPMPAVQPALPSIPEDGAKAEYVAPAAKRSIVPAATETAATVQVATLPVAAAAPAISLPASLNISPSVLTPQADMSVPVEVSGAPKSADATMPVVTQPTAAPKPSGMPVQIGAPTVPTDPAIALAPEQPALGQAQPASVKAEAVSLLQLVRDHMRDRTTALVGESKAAGVKDSVPDAASATLLALPANDGVTMPVSQAPVVTAAQASVATAPSVDLSVSIGAQVVDIGVSGQWIDGLARDIAGLSANGAQGRFQINADQLGPVQVDIRQGEDGAAVSLTVATEAAELALRQDSDRLKIDAGLSAVRISEVKVERTPHLTETARSDAPNNQSGSQSQSQSQGQSASWQGQGQGMGQSSAQSHMQGRGEQQRENIGFNHKGSSDPAVLNHERAGVDAGDLPRARYA